MESIKVEMETTGNNGKPRKTWNDKHSRITVLAAVLGTIGAFLCLAIVAPPTIQAAMVIFASNDARPRGLTVRAKCPKCGVVFETPWHPTLVHVGSLKLMKCPACGKSSMMHTKVNDPVTWPVGTGETEKVKTEKEMLEERIESSKYERQGSS
ncbi:MAG: hypothetical protein SA339_03720 [Methanomassiliicoccus sp.]|nr:hypothetical protein [Methanomassiliicoccus sp.]